MGDIVVNVGDSATEQEQGEEAPPLTPPAPPIVMPVENESDTNLEVIEDKVEDIVTAQYATLEAVLGYQASVDERFKTIEARLTTLGDGVGEQTENAATENEEPSEEIEEELTEEVGINEIPDDVSDEVVNAEPGDGPNEDVAPVVENAEDKVSRPARKSDKRPNRKLGFRAFVLGGSGGTK